MRLIDASGFERELIADMSLYGEKISGDEAYSRALLLLAGASTLTPPNEAPPCYRTDSDGCAYQCYDGDDEPIEKCKECPLCYSDKQRHYTPPNEPLTLEELRQMDGQPVWVEDVKHWALIDIEKGGQWDGVPFVTWEKNGARFCHNVIDRNLLCYRRPPEGKEGTK